MSIRYKLLLSMLLIALLFIPVNIYLLKRYSDVKQDFLTMVDKTVPRLEALFSMQNLTTRISLFINNFNAEFQRATINSNTPTQVGVVKDAFLALLEELGEQQKIYKKYRENNSNSNTQQLTQLRDEVILAALDVFSGKEQGINTQALEEKAGILESKEKQLNDFIKTLLLQESSILDDERQKLNNAAVELRNLLLLFNGLIILITIILSLILMRLISKPIISLSKFASNIDYDNLKPLLPLLSKDEIGSLQDNLNNMLIKLDKAKTTLIETSRAAGVAEIATSILHNVGNVLNSINTSVALLSENTRKSSITQLPKLLAILEENQNNLDEYLSHDERGKLFIPYFKKLIEHLESDRLKTQAELDNLNKNLMHVNQIIAMQQSSSRPGSHILESINIDDLIEDTLLLYANRLRKNSINVERQFSSVSPILSVKNKIQQILINLVKNAIDALIVSKQPEKRLVIKVNIIHDKKNLKISIRDNGVGISKDDLPKIFSFGFTTKQEGHGYGLHNSALLATELGGELKANSAGLNQGATFTLCIPIETK